jgi:hypothetical protein
MGNFSRLLQVIGVRLAMFLGFSQHAFSGLGGTPFRLLIPHPKVVATNEKSTKLAALFYLRRGNIFVAMIQALELVDDMLQPMHARLQIKWEISRDYFRL